MSDRLPTTKPEWKKAAKGNGVGDTQQLAIGAAFVSGSKFQFEHFLRLRVLYKEKQSPIGLAKSPWFPGESLQEVANILKGEPDTLYLREFLGKEEAIESGWDVEKAKKSGGFAIAMELLHLIASRKILEMNIDDDNTDTKIVLSPNKSSKVNQSDSHNRTLSKQEAATPTPLPRFRYDNYFESPLSDPDISGLSIALPGKENAQIRYEHQRMEDEFERSDFSPGDEQTVNAALVALIMALSWLLKSTGCVHHDRASFSIPSGNEDNDLYKAGVDGLILHPGKQKCNAFMEVKRDYRGQNKAVRRQIAAQMAAFIFQQDIVLAGQETEQQTVKETEKAKKGKGKQAPRKGKQTADDENQIEYEDGRNRKK